MMGRNVISARVLNDDNLHNTFVTNGIYGRILFENDIQNRNLIEKEAGKAVDLLVEHRVLLLAGN